MANRSNSIISRVRSTLPVKHRPIFHLVIRLLVVHIQIPGPDMIEGNRFILNSLRNSMLPPYQPNNTSLPNTRYRYNIHPLDAQWCVAYPIVAHHRVHPLEIMSLVNTVGRLAKCTCLARDVSLSVYVVTIYRSGLSTARPDPTCRFPNCYELARWDLRTDERTEYCGQEHMQFVVILQSLFVLWC